MAGPPRPAADRPPWVRVTYEQTPRARGTWILPSPGEGPARGADAAANQGTGGGSAAGQCRYASTGTGTHQAAGNGTCSGSLATGGEAEGNRQNQGKARDPHGNPPLDRRLRWEKKRVISRQNA